MLTFRIRGRRWWLVAIAAVLFAILAALSLKPMLEQAVRARIEAAAVSRGMVARIGQVHLGVWPFVRLERFDLDAGHGLQLHADEITATWSRRLRLAIRAATIAAPGTITVSSPASAWDVEGIRGGDLVLTLVEPQSGLSVRKSAAPGSAWSIETRGLDVSRLLDVRRDTHSLVDMGVADGRVDFQVSTDVLRFHVDMSARGARVQALADSAIEEVQLGDATNVVLRFDGTWRRAEGAVEIPIVHATVAGADWSGSLALRDLKKTDPAIDLALGVRQLDFAQLLSTLGLAVPESLRLPPGRDAGLGLATIEVQVRGRLSDAASLSVSQKIGFTPPRQIPPGIVRLRRDFVFDADEGAGPHRSINVSPASADFIALGDVPPLFVRTLLLAEDSSFYGHRGIDLRELPGALVTNWSRGRAARGASTITQQLAKNLFLSRDKQVGRKLQELAITFLLESALGKDRILEIYFNIIEWGPDLRGLRPAARRYFGREPRELTPAEMAFLVSIIPGPIKYQRSFARGTPGPGLRTLIDALLAKLRSVDAISETEYRQALGETIIVSH